MDSLKKRAGEIITVLKDDDKKEFGSTKELIQYLKKYFNESERTLQNTIKYAVEEGLLERGKKSGFGKGSPLIILDKPKKPKKAKKASKGKKAKSRKKSLIGTKEKEKSRKTDLGFVQLIDLLVERVEESIGEQDAKIEAQKKEIFKLKETLKKLQIDENKIAALEEKVNAIEKELSTGVDKLLDAIGSLKGKS